MHKKNSTAEKISTGRLADETEEQREVRLQRDAEQHRTVHNSCSAQQYKRKSRNFKHTAHTLEVPQPCTRTYAKKLIYLEFLSRM